MSGTPVSMNCDRLAPWYQSLEYACFGRELERRRVAYLAETVACERALICGGGDGRFLARLLSFNANVAVDFVDLSGRMIEIAQNRVTGMGQRFRRRVRFYTSDIRAFRAESSSYDLIVTHFFLDCFRDGDVEAVVGLLAGLARKDAQWLLSEFREERGPIARLYTLAVTRTLYRAFNLTTGLGVTRLPDYEKALTSRGFRRKFVQTSLGGLLCSSLWRADRRACEVRT